MGPVAPAAEPADLTGLTVLDIEWWKRSYDALQRKYDELEANFYTLAEYSGTMAERFATNRGNQMTCRDGIAKDHGGHTVRIETRSLKPAEAYP